MNDLEKIISGLSKSGLLSGLAGGLAGGSAASLLANKKGRKTAKKALKYGALAAAGGIAWKAYQNYSGNNSAQKNSSAVPQPTTPGSSQFGQRDLTYTPQTLSQQQFASVLEDSNAEQGQMLLLRAMITAANADGHIDGDERERIYQRVETMDLSVADKAALFDELRKPLNLEQLAAQVPNSQTAMEVYAASLIAIDETQPASTVYLRSLASYLCIPAELVQALHSQTAQAIDQ